MTIQGRSLDDLPLAAYSTGAEPEPGLEVPEVDAPGAMAPRTAVPPIDEAAVAALPLADGEPDPDAKTAHLRVPVGRPLPGLPAMPEWLAHPRRNLRDPRLLLSGMAGVGLVLLVLSVVLSAGGPAGLGAANASPSAPAFVATAPPPAGNASVDVTGKLAGLHELTGVTGAGPAVGTRIDATWSSTAGATLSLSGAASPGTRTTDPTFVLTWTLLVDGEAITFTSDSGECTVGMAVQPKTVSGSFVCKKLRSDDGKQTINARGTYRT